MQAARALVFICAAALAAPAAAAPSTTPSTTTAPASTSKSAKTSPTFGPFDSGSKRPVTRQGKKGLSRTAHPIVGNVAQIPGGGPPPPPLRRDPELPETALQTPNAAPGLSANPLYLASLFYSQFLTRTDGPRCQHLPTCSRFASQAVARYGPFGIPIGLDRTIQPGQSSALRTLPELEYGGVFRHYDPLENYEFWHPERFTGFPVATPEETLAGLPSTPTPSTSTPTPSTPTSTSTSTSMTPTTSTAPAPSLASTAPLAAAVHP
jgi:hypothetical protein